MDVRGAATIALIVALAATPGCATATPASTSSPSSVSPSATPPSVAPPTVTPPSMSPPGVSPSIPPTSPVLRRLDALVVKGRAPRTGYSRTKFGQAWSDDVSVAEGHNGCDTRNDILRRDLRDIRLKPGTRDCVVLSGTLVDPYTGTTIHFVRGPQSARVQIDHVVALSDAWQKGAQQWTPDKRRDFANDPRNLRAVSGAANQRKGDGDTATWLPPNKAFRCTYVSDQVTVKYTYGLWVTAAEKDAMRRVLSTCFT
uniref:HNH endonuclease family protein n=1 Tax=Gordonia sp. B7-2 TaxID=3420932 RepID=UPI003D947B10